MLFGKNIIAMMNKLSLTLLGVAILAAAIPACAKAGKGKEKISIEWGKPLDVCAGGYGRVHSIGDGRLMLCYSSGGSDYVRFSTDEGASWGQPIMVMETFDHTTDKGTATLRCANPEFAKLSDGNPHHPGRIILAANLRPKDNKSTVHPFSIVCSVSDNEGISWSERKTVYASRTWDTDASKGAWEPFVLELPDGTVQIYFTDNTPYYAAGDSRGNNISVVESADGGDTWGPERVVCHSEGGWDGMPVVTLLDGRLYLVVEHKDVRGGSYPMTIQCMSCTLNENWPQEISVNSSRRFYPFGINPCYIGAPYIIHTDNYFVISGQSAEGSEEPMKDTYSVPEVYVCPISAASAENEWKWRKMRSSRPMDIDQSRYSGLWNSLCHIGGDRILCVTQHRGHIYVTPGNIVQK